jgi:hypothetical protein
MIIRFGRFSGVRDLKNECDGLMVSILSKCLIGRSENALFARSLSR